MLKLNRIEKLEPEDYVLVAHPYPQMDGEMLLFQIEQEIQEKDRIIYKDFSLRRRIETQPKPARLSAFQKKTMQEEDAEKTKLQCLEIDLESPLSTIDWGNFSMVISEIQGMGWIQILPYGQKSSQPYQFNMMHILPSSKIPFEKVPLDMMISNKSTFIKKQEKRMAAASQMGGKQHRPVQPRETQAQEQGLLLIDEFLFPHAVFLLSKTDMNAEGLLYGYKKLA